MSFKGSAFFHCKFSLIEMIMAKMDPKEGKVYQGNLFYRTAIRANGDNG